MVGNFQKKPFKTYTVGFFNHPQVVNSPFTNECIDIKYNTTGGVIKHKL